MIIKQVQMINNYCLLLLNISIKFYYLIYIFDINIEDNKIKYIKSMLHFFDNIFNSLITF